MSDLGREYRLMELGESGRALLPGGRREEAKREQGQQHQQQKRGQKEMQ